MQAHDETRDETQVLFGLAIWFRWATAPAAVVALTLTFSSIATAGPGLKLIRKGVEAVGTVASKDHSNAADVAVGAGFVGIRAGGKYYATRQRSSEQGCDPNSLIGTTECSTASSQTAARVGLLPGKSLLDQLGDGSTLGGRVDRPTRSRALPIGNGEDSPSFDKEGFLPDPSWSTRSEKMPHGAITHDPPPKSLSGDSGTRAPFRQDSRQALQWPAVLDQSQPDSENLK